MGEDYKNWFREIYFSVMDPLANQKKLLKFDIFNAKADEQSAELLESITDDTVKKFYTIRNKWKVVWSTRIDSGLDAEGTFDFIALDRVMLDDVWDNEFGGNDWAPDNKGFRPIDMFYDINGMVGFFTDRSDKKGLYLMHSDSSMSALNVDLDGYLRLLGMSKGFGWWQNALVEIHTGKTMPNVADFKEKMPKIFPDFSWDAFVSLYEEVRIDK